MSGNATINTKSYPEKGNKVDYQGIPSQALDAIRMRLAQLVHSLKRIKDELSKPELSQRYSLQAQLTITLQQLLSVTSTLEHFEGTLDSSIIYPLPEFPTTSHENLLTTLLRTKYTPEVDDWLKSSQDAAEIDVKSLTESKIKEILQTDRDTTKWALEIFSKEFEKYNSKTSQDLSNEEDSMSIDEEDRYSHYKPSHPFEVENILSYMYGGNL